MIPFQGPGWTYLASTQRHHPVVPRCRGPRMPRKYLVPAHIPYYRSRDSIQLIHHRQTRRHWHQRHRRNPNGRCQCEMYYLRPLREEKGELPLVEKQTLFQHFLQGLHQNRWYLSQDAGDCASLSSDATVAAPRGHICLIQETLIPYFGEWTKTSHRYSYQSAWRSACGCIPDAT